MENDNKNSWNTYNVEVIKLAVDLSDLVINKILAKEISMEEALNATLLIPTLIAGKTMTKEMQTNQFDKITPLATEISINIKDSTNNGNYNISDIILAMGIVLEYIINNLKDKG